MTTIPFTPNSNLKPPFTAIVTLGGASYTLTASWNIARPDWYISLTDQNGNLIITQPLIASPPDADIFLATGIAQFAPSTLLYRAATEQFEITP